MDVITVFIIGAMPEKEHPPLVESAFFRQQMMGFCFLTAVIHYLKCDNNNPKFACPQAANPHNGRGVGKKCSKTNTRR